jgi:hypothetical protein
MRMIIHTIMLLVVVALAGPSSSVRAQSSSSDLRPLRERIVGTWRFVKYFNTDAADKITYPFGEQPMGYVVWDNTGHVSVQVARPPGLKPFASGDDLRGNDDEIRAAFERYDAYFGTYEVDEKNSMVIHHVAGSLRPSYTDIDQRRPFRLKGDSLIIEFSNQGSRRYRELERVR